MAGVQPGLRDTDSAPCAHPHPQALRLPPQHTHSPTRCPGGSFLPQGTGTILSKEGSGGKLPTEGSAIITALLVAENLQTKHSRRDTEGREEEEDELSLPTHGKAFAWEQGLGVPAGWLSLHLRATGCCSQASLSSRFLNEH